MLKVRKLKIDLHVNVSITGSQNYVNPVDYESINEGTDLTQDPVNTVSEFVEGKVDRCYIVTTIIGNSNSEVEVQIQNKEECNIMVDLHDEIDLCEIEQIPHAMVTEGQILEEFMLEEEIEFQGIDKCKIVELPDEQDIEKCIDIEKCAVRSSKMTVRIAYEQEESIEEENCNRSLLKLPKLYRAEENVHKDKMKIETHKINAVEISELPREVKLGMPIEQSESKLGVNMFNDMPTPDQAEHEISLPNETTNLCRTSPFEIPVPSRKILDKSISKLHNVSKMHIRQRKVLGSKLVRRVNTTRLVKRKIPSICRPPPKPPDRHGRLNIKVSKRILTQVHAKEDIIHYRPSSKPPFIVNANREGIRDPEKEDYYIM